MSLLIAATLMLLLLVGGVFVVVIVVVATRSRPQPAAPVLTQGPGGLAPVPSSWHAQVLGAGALGSTYGTMTLDAGRLAFTPDGAGEPAWAAACHEVWVRRQGVGPFAIAGVGLHGPMGEVQCNVSREHINRFSTNTLKDFRQSGYADQFVAAAHAHGARVM